MPAPRGAPRTTRGDSFGPRGAPQTARGDLSAARGAPQTPENSPRTARGAPQTPENSPRVERGAPQIAEKLPRGVGCPPRDTQARRSPAVAARFFVIGWEGLSQGRKIGGLPRLCPAESEVTGGFRATLSPSHCRSQSPSQQTALPEKETPTAKPHPKAPDAAPAPHPPR